MAHYAKINNENIVTDVIVADEDFINTLDGIWLQTSYNTRGGVHYDPLTGNESKEKQLRKNYAGIGFIYDESSDAFIPPKPFQSWTLNNETYLWEAPVDLPDDGEYYNWDEENLKWIKQTQLEGESNE